MIEQHYELLYIIPVKFVGEEQDKIMEKATAIVKDNGGEITKNVIFSKQRLAYPIAQVHQGTYVIIEFDAKTSDVQKMHEVLALTPEVLRHMIVTKKKMTPDEIMAQNRKKERIAQSEKKEKEQDIQKKVEEVHAEVKESTKESKKDKLSLEDLDKKLDEILKDDISGV